MILRLPIIKILFEIVYERIVKLVRKVGLAKS